MTITSTALDLMSISAMCMASSPLPGWLDQQRFQLDAQLLGPAGVQGVLGVDEGGDAAVALRLGHDVQGERRLAAGFGAEDLDDPPVGMPWPPMAMSSERLPVEMPVIAADVVGAQRHDGPFAELLLDLGDGRLQGGWAASIASTPPWPSVAGPAVFSAVFFAMERFTLLRVAVTTGWALST